MEFTELSRKEFTDDKEAWHTINDKKDTSKEQKNTNVPT